MPCSFGHLSNHINEAGWWTQTLWHLICSHADDAKRTTSSANTDATIMSLNWKQSRPSPTPLSELMFAKNLDRDLTKWFATAPSHRNTLQ